VDLNRVFQSDNSEENCRKQQSTYLLAWKRLEPCNHNIFIQRLTRKKNRVCQRNNISHFILQHSSYCSSWWMFCIWPLPNIGCNFLYGMSVFFLTCVPGFFTVVHQVFLWCVPCGFKHSLAIYVLGSSRMHTESMDQAYCTPINKISVDKIHKVSVDVLQNVGKDHKIWFRPVLFLFKWYYMQQNFICFKKSK